MSADHSEYGTKYIFPYPSPAYYALFGFVFVIAIDVALNLWHHAYPLIAHNVPFPIFNE